MRHSNRLGRMAIHPLNEMNLLYSSHIQTSHKQHNTIHGDSISDYNVWLPSQNYVIERAGKVYISIKVITHTIIVQYL